MRKLTIDEIKAAFAQKAWVLKSDTYVSSGKMLEVICPRGHETTISWNNFQRGQGCKFCANNVKFDFEYVKQQFQNRGCELLEIIYINNNTPLKYRCKCGNLAQIKLLDFMRGHECIKCMARKISQKLKTPDEEIIKICQANNCQFIKSWIKDRRTRISYICACGRESEANLSNFKRFPNCKKCGSAKVSGDKCYMYDPDRSAVEMRKKFRKICDQHIKRFMESTGQTKTRHTHELLGYTPQQLQEHILNHPDFEKCKDKLWHVDHVMPIKAFMDHNILDLKIINALNNLRPMPGPENLSKTDKYNEEEFQRCLSNNIARTNA